jgi:hypothetical protein
MTTYPRLRRLAAALTLLLPWLAGAAEPLIFDSCLDARGQTVAAVADPELPVLVRGDSVQGQPVLRYNPDLLPRLDQPTRLFFYAHQCARLGLPASDQANGAASAHQADCLGLGALLASTLLRRADLPTLQAALVFSDAEWALLPGPPRSFDLASCPVSDRGVLRLPVATMPSAQQIAWNNCTRACGDRLWQCQKQCGHADCASCQSPFNTCRNACGSGPERDPAR